MCASPHSYPAARLKFYINDEIVSLLGSSDVVFVVDNDDDGDDGDDDVDEDPTRLKFYINDEIVSLFGS